MSNSEQDFSQPSENKKLNSWFHYKEMTINQKIRFILMNISLLSLAFIGIISYYSSRNALETVAFSQLKSINETKKRAAEDYFKQIKNQVLTLAEDRMIADAVKEFKEAYKIVDTDTLTNYSNEDIMNMESGLKYYYNTNFIEPLNYNLQEELTTETYWPNNVKANVLQYNYIVDNPNMHDKSILEKASDGSLYSSIHEKYHNILKDYRDKFSFEDIYIIDAENGNILYSVQKKTDFGTNLVTGPYRESKLALAYEIANKSTVKNSYTFVDMDFYPASLGKPYAFLAAPIYDGYFKTGVLVLQISPNHINKIMTGEQNWVKDGLGKTGQTYLVGEDMFLRSDLRGMLENKNAYLVDLQNNGKNEKTIQTIERLNTGMMSHKIESEAVRESAINGRSDQRIDKNYNGKKVLSTYSTIKFGESRWGIISEIQEKEIYKPVKILRRRLLFGIIVILILVNILGFFVSKTIAEKIIKVKDDINKMARGETIDRYSISWKDEIGETVSALNILADRLDMASDFAVSIGKGNFNFDYSVSSSKDRLGNSLIQMKKSLEDAKEEERKRTIEDEKRNWATHGIAKFGEILRSDNDNLNKLSYNIISNLTDFLKANQGGLFLMNEDDPDNKFLELLASYAYNRQKHITKKILVGEGLVGICALEKKTIFLKEIPEDYINITSGLGDSNPSSLLIVPLRIDKQVLGIIEIASFNEFEPHEIEFVETLAESIATTVTTVSINARTAKLLEESKDKANALSQQEEEMRQNMEEMKATQEELHRIKNEEAEKDKERRNKEQELLSQLQEQNDVMTEQQDQLLEEKALLDALLNNLPDYIYFKDLNCKFIKNSLSQVKSFGYDNPEELLGKSDFDFHEKSAAQEKYNDEQEIIKSGKGFINKVEHDVLQDGTEEWLSSTKLPLYDTNGNCIGLFGISKIITEFKKLEIEARSKSEELLSREEKMQIVQDELSKRTYLMDALLKSLPDHIYFKDEESRFIEFSDSMLKLFKIKDKNELIGKSDFDVFGEEHARPAFEDEQKIIKTGKPIINKIEKEVHKDGTISYVSTTKLPLYDDKGNIVGTFGISKDISEQKQMEEETMQLIGDLEKLKADKKVIDVVEKTKEKIKNLRKKG